MSRTLDAALQSHVATYTHSRCRMLLLLLQDGTKLGITDHDQDITFTLPEDGDEIVYSAKSGFRISDVETNINLDPGSYEIRGPIADVVTKAQLLGGRWRNAVTYLFEVNWQSPTAAIDLMKGTVTPKDNGGEFVFEVKDDRYRLAQTVGRGITNQCRRKKASCCVNIAPETETTVSVVTSTLELEVDAAITDADFVGGKLWFTTGDLVGNPPVEIFKVTSGAIELFEPLPALPDVGDEVTLKEGCDGTLAMCRDRFDNAINFDGFPAVRGNKILLPAIPGQGNDDD